MIWKNFREDVQSVIEKGTGKWRATKEGKLKFYLFTRQEIHEQVLMEKSEAKNE